MVKMLGVNNFDLKDRGIASLKKKKCGIQKIALCRITGTPPTLPESTGIPSK